MLIFMDPCSINPKEWVGKPARDGGIAEIAVDDDDGENTEEEVVAEAVETVECVEGPDYAIGVGIKEGDVLL